MGIRMMRMALVVGMVATGCGEATDPVEDTGNETLGIARYVVNEDGDRTTIRGLDADGTEIAALDLVHGRFALTGIFRDDYPTPEVVGRKLDIDVKGQQLVWETAGFEPTLHMPAPLNRKPAVAALVEDPQVKAVLAHWGIGFAPAAAFTGEASYYTSDTFYGSDITDCSGQTTCGTVRNLTINTCGNSAAAGAAMRVTTSWEVLVAQCCPSGSGGMDTDWYGFKACPLEGTTSECGTASGACKACPGFPEVANSLCYVYQSSSSTIVATRDYYHPNWAQCGQPDSCYIDNDCVGAATTTSCEGGVCQCW